MERSVACSSFQALEFFVGHEMKISIDVLRASSCKKMEICCIMFESSCLLCLETSTGQKSDLGFAGLVKNPNP